MPELPEVETTRRGIKPFLQAATLQQVLVRQRQLRWPVPQEVLALRQQPVLGLTRRAKFLQVRLPQGELLIHLGMSGSLRVVDAALTPNKHDHFDLLLDDGKAIRYNDPRRFGALLWAPTGELHPLLQHLGPEPLSDAFNGHHLWQHSRRRSVAVKNFIMDNKVVVGVGNIYAQESLFLAGIHPSRAANRISQGRYQALAESIREVLERAIVAGGTTLRDFSQADGQPGYFAQALNVYGRAGENCLKCGTVLKGARHGQRSTCYCPVCQR